MSNLARPPATTVVEDRTQEARLPAVAVVTTTKQGVTVLRDEKGHLLPGQPSMNPGGRPVGLGRRVREMVNFDKAIETLVDIAWGKLAPASRVADRIKAIELLMDRGYGKAAQVVDLKDGNVRADKFKAMSTPKLIATVEAMRALATGATADTNEE